MINWSRKEREVQKYIYGAPYMKIGILEVKEHKYMFNSYEMELYSEGGGKSVWRGGQGAHIHLYNRNFVRGKMSSLPASFHPPHTPPAPSPCVPG